MSKYTNVIYPDVENSYPAKLCKYIYKKFIDDIRTSPLKLLDIGYGKGTHFKEFKKFGLDCYGVDLYKDMDNDEEDHLKVFQCNLNNETLPFNNETFDVVWSKSVIEHIKNSDNFLNEIYRVLSPGGVCIIMTPDWESQMKTFYDDYTHVKPWTVKGLRNALTIKNFRDVGSEKFYQLPFVWKYPFLKFIPNIISLCPQSWKWKDKTMANGRDRKLIRFSMDKMILARGIK